MPFVKGHRHSEETKRKIKKNNAKYWLGKKRPENCNGHLGKKLSKALKKKLSDAHKGLPSGMKGKKMSKESRQKMRLAKLGTKQSEETKLKRKKSMIKFYKNNLTSIEIKLYNELKRRNIDFVDQHIIHGFIVDVYIPSLKLVIEADGDYWHSRENMKKRDKIKDAVLAKYNYKILRISETNINNNAFVNILEKELHVN